MPYVTSSGEITDKQPWGLAKITAFFGAILNFFFMFFRTLISPGSDSGRGRYTQDFRPGGGGVHHVTSERDFNEKLRQAGSKLVVVDFSATWCGPCRAIAPEVDKLAAQKPNVVFLKVDVDECRELAKTYNVEGMPTFVFIKNGKQEKPLVGADKDQLRYLVQIYG